jgi:hypothetical protein
LKGVNAVLSFPPGLGVHNVKFNPQEYPASLTTILDEIHEHYQLQAPLPEPVPKRQQAPLCCTNTHIQDKIKNTIRPKKLIMQKRHAQDSPSAPYPMPESSQLPPALIDAKIFKRKGLVNQICQTIFFLCTSWGLDELKQEHPSDYDKIMASILIHWYKQLLNGNFPELMKRQNRVLGPNKANWDVNWALYTPTNKDKAYESNMDMFIADPANMAPASPAKSGCTAAKISVTPGAEQLQTRACGVVVVVVSRGVTGSEMGRGI